MNRRPKEAASPLRAELQGQARRWVVKIGSSLLTNDGAGLDLAWIARWMEQIRGLHREGREVVLVSSGAVSAGTALLGWSQRPNDLASRQAAASVGQSALIHHYEKILQQVARPGDPPLHCGQVLLTHDELRNRRRYLNARNIVRVLLDRNVLPVVNENDAISYRSIQLGDNDTLAAMVCNLLDADILVLLTDQDGLFSADPRQDPHAEFLKEVTAGDPRLEAIAGSGGSGVGTGGMLAKVKAATRAARSGTATVVANGRHPDILPRLAQGQAIGTFFRVRGPALRARKRWLSDHLRVPGSLILDAGAVRALRDKGRSLLSVGVLRVEGDFRRGDLVACRSEDGCEVARGLIDVDAAVMRRILGRGRAQLAEDPTVVDSVVIHRNNLVLSDTAASHGLDGGGDPKTDIMAGSPASAQDGGTLP